MRGFSGSWENQKIMDGDDDYGMLLHEFAPGEEPSVYTTDICVEVGHEYCKGISRTIEGFEGELVFCICLCHRVINGKPI